MEKINNRIKTHIQIITFLIIWAVILVISKTFSSIDLWYAIKQIPQAISIYALVSVVFIKWIWRWKVLQGWLIKVPDIEGTWQGVLKSDWINPSTQQCLDPIPIILTIKQNFSEIKCTLMTQESTSYSTTASINALPGGDDLYLTYNYTNRPKVTLRDRSEIHDGAAILKIIRKPTYALDGEYWTSRKTRGDMVLEFETREVVERFS